MHSTIITKRLYAGLFALLSLSFFISLATAGDIEPYLPKDRIIHGRIMELTAPRVLHEISLKIQTAAQNDQVWFKSYIEENAEIRPLPYHPRLGVTEVEYQKLLTLMGQLEMQETGSTLLKVQRLEDGGFQLLSDDESMPLNGIRMFPAENFIETGYGDLGEFSEINQSNPNSPTGRWTGLQWKKAERTADRILAVKLAIGKRTDEGDGIIYYDVKNFSAGVAEEYSVILVYPLQ